MSLAKTESEACLIDISVIQRGINPILKKHLDQVTFGLDHGSLAGRLKSLDQRKRMILSDFRQGQLGLSTLSDFLNPQGPLQLWLPKRHLLIRSAGVCLPEDDSFINCLWLKTDCPNQQSNPTPDQITDRSLRGRSSEAVVVQLENERAQRSLTVALAVANQSGEVTAQVGYVLQTVPDLLSVKLSSIPSALSRYDGTLLKNLPLVSLGSFNQMTSQIAFWQEQAKSSS